MTALTMCVNAGIRIEVFFNREPGLLLNANTFDERVRIEGKTSVFSIEHVHSNKDASKKFRFKKWF